MGRRYDRSGERVLVYKRDAERTLAAIRRMFRSWLGDGAEEPTLVKDYDYGGGTVPYAILWEGGPYDWAVTATLGGINEEEGSLAAEFGFKSRSHEPIEVENVFLEPITGWSLGIYPDR